MSSAGAGIAISGCLDEFDSQNEDDENDGDDDTDRVVVREGADGCLEKDDWSDDATTGSADPEPGSIADQLDCSNATRPEPTGDLCATFEVTTADDERTYESAGIRRYPDPLTTFDEETITSFVAEYEQAYAHNSSVEESGKNLTGFGINIDDDLTRAFDTDTERTLLRIQYHTSESIVTDNGHSSGGGPGAAVYAVDETAIARSEDESRDDVEELDSEEIPDPVEDGDLLQCF
ncbi:hypothetical protein OB905_05245 [Halobacteria archaeon AArc-dxtr1]|nr:hypothetical protein [Halobacteria archaeon AArc-dxtr1]